MDNIQDTTDAYYVIQVNDPDILIDCLNIKGKSMGVFIDDYTSPPRMQGYVQVPSREAFEMLLNRIKELEDKVIELSKTANAKTT